MFKQPLHKSKYNVLQRSNSHKKKEVRKKELTEVVGKQCFNRMLLHLPGIAGAIVLQFSSCIFLKGGSAILKVLDDYR